MGFLKKLSSAVAIVFIACGPLVAQVSSRAYSIMLKGMYNETVELIGCDELASQLSDVVLLDTRAPKEFEVSHLKNARWVGYEAFSKSKVKDLDKDQTIVVYCSVGARSEKIGERLLKMGFTNVYNLHGGIFEWVNRDYEVVDSQGKPTQRVHAYSKTWGVWLQKGEKVYD